jgi:hypothetical protein
VVNGRHAGENTGRPDYAYTGRHEAPPAAPCTAHLEIHNGDGETSGLLVCNRSAHDPATDQWHMDDADGVMWAAAPALLAPAERFDQVMSGAVA